MAAATDALVVAGFRHAAIAAALCHLQLRPDIETRAERRGDGRAPPLPTDSPFGMVTNYQVVAETATRAVVRVTPVITTNPDGSSNTNYNTRIEQFNVLGPD